MRRGRLVLPDFAGGELMAFSLNEIEVMGKRAARGAGLPWGHAEEAGKAARWLIERGYPGPEALADILTRNDKHSFADLAPDTAEPVWRSRSDRLCPLITGTVLCDRAAEIAAGREVELGAISQPLLLVPYLAGAAELADMAVEVTWPGATVTLTPTGAVIEGDMAALTARSAETARCRRVEPPAVTTLLARQGRDAAAETWSRLNAFALRVFAPATEASRLAGAGAGLTDND